MNDSIIRVPTPKQSLEYMGNSLRKEDFSPTSLLFWKKIGGIESGKLLRVLFDSGGQKTMIKRSALPEGAEVKVDPNAK